MDPWEALDIDDGDDAVSELPSFSLRPCNRSSSPSAASPVSIPGPAGAIQAAMHRRASSDDPMIIPTQEFIRRVVETGDGNDQDFAASPWLCALNLLSKDGGDFARTPLGSIKKGQNGHKVSQVVAMIKSCTPNGLGDLMLTLKDPTGTIGATIHHNALSEGEFGRSISVAAVLVLQKVAVFSPSRSACYLNVTLNNIVRVISKDSGPIATKDLPTPAVNNLAPVNGASKKLWMPLEKVVPSQENTQRIMSYLRPNSEVIVSHHNVDKRVETGHTVPGRSSSGHVHRGSQIVDVEKMSGREDLVDVEQVNGAAEEHRMAEGERLAAANSINHNRVPEGGNLWGISDATATVVAEKLKRRRLAEEDNPSSITQPISDLSSSVETPDNHRILTGSKRQRQPLSLKASIPDYTEEQLNLFDFD